MFSWTETIRPTNSGNVLPGPLQKNSAHPALELCCPKCGLWTSSIDCPRRQLGHGILSLSQTCWLRISRSQMSPAHNTVWEALVSRPCSVILRMHPPQVQPERTKGCGHLEPCRLQAVLWAPGPRIPVPIPSASLPPGAHVLAWQVVKILLFMGGKSVAWVWTWRIGVLLLEQQIPQGTEKVRARGGKSKGRGLGAGSAPPSAVLPSGLELSVQNPSLPGVNS